MVKREEKARIVITVREDVKQKLETLSYIAGTSLSDYANKIIEKALPDLISEAKQNKRRVVAECLLTNPMVYQTTEEWVRSEIDNLDNFSAEEKHEIIINYAIKNFESENIFRTGSEKIDRIFEF